MVVEDELLESKHEWEKKKRTGSFLKPFKLKRGLTTSIDYRNTDFFGKPIPPIRIQEFYRLRQKHYRLSKEGTEGSNLSIALPHIRRVCFALGLGMNVVEGASQIYRKVINDSNCQKKVIMDLVSASIYITCREKGIPIIVKELEEIAMAKNTIKYCSKIREALGIKLESITPKLYIPYFATRLGVSGYDEWRAEELCERLLSSGVIVGMRPAPIAAAVLVYVSGKEYPKEWKKYGNIKERVEFIENFENGRGLVLWGRGK